MANEASFNHPFMALADAMGNTWVPPEPGQWPPTEYKVKLQTRNFGTKDHEHVRVKFRRINGFNSIDLSAYRHGELLRKKSLMVIALMAMNDHYALWAETHGQEHFVGTCWAELVLRVQREAALECYVPLLWAAAGDGVQRKQLQVKRLT